jgi:hypothetical protein
MIPRYRVLFYAPEGLPKAPIKEFYWYSARFAKRPEADAHAEAVIAHFLAQGVIVTGEIKEW